MNPGRAHTPTPYPEHYDCRECSAHLDECLAVQSQIVNDLRETLCDIGQSLRRMSMKEADMFIVQAACDALAVKAESALSKAKGESK